MLAGEEHIDELVWPLFSAGMQRAQYTQWRETDGREPGSEKQTERHGLDTIQSVWKKLYVSIMYI